MRALPARTEPRGNAELSAVRRFSRVFAGSLLFAAVASLAVAQPASQKPRYQKLDSALNELMLRRAAAGPDASRRAAVERQSAAELGLIEFGDRRIGVTIRFRGAGQTVATLVVSRNGHIAYRFAAAIEAYVDPAVLSEIDALADVDRIERIPRVEPQVVSQGVQVHNAVPWQAAGYTGQGVKIGIIDVGFVGWSALPSADMPSLAAVRCYTGGGSYSTSLASCETSSSHGTAVAEAAHDVAPDAAFYLSKVVTLGDIHDAVGWMIQQGVRVINMSFAVEWDGPGDGTSPYADSVLKAVDTAVAGGALVSIASGNYATAAWFGPWQDVDGDSYLEFLTADRYSCLNAGSFTSISLELRWQDAWGGATRDLDLELYRQSDGALVASSRDNQNGGASHVPHESLSYLPVSSGTYCVAVTRYSGAAPSWVQLRVSSQQSLDAFTSAGSVTSPAETANPGALAVGAANWQTPDTIESFSSRGPTPDGRVKPEIVGVDRADSYTYGTNAFPGTSQSAPHIAGLGALLVQAYPASPPNQISTMLKTWALEHSGAGAPDDTWGYGLAYLPSVYRLTILKDGSGAGTVTSVDSAVNCGTTCGAIYLGGTVVQLTATAASGSVFAGWTGGGCTGSGGCAVTMDAATVVTATFVPSAAAPTFTDTPLQPGTTIVKLVHIAELRQAIETLRARYGLPAPVWTDATLVARVTSVKAAHLTELRTALNQVYGTAGRTPPSYSHPVLTSGATIITAVDIEELRAAIVAIW